MTVFAIATFPDEPFSTQTTKLAGVAYKLTFALNTREDCWYLSIADAAGTPLAIGIKLVANWPLLENLTNPALPPGELYALVLGPDDEDPGKGELGAGLRAELIYTDEVVRFP
jgi:hypothetical protein